MALSNLPSANKGIYVHSASPHFKVLKSLFLGYKPVGDASRIYRVEVLQGKFRLGNGHFFQRLQRAFGIEVSLRPQGSLLVTQGSSIRKQIALHLSVGHFANHQKHIHPRARQLYPEHRETLQQFVNQNKQFDFVEVGTEFSGLENVTNSCNLDLHQTLAILSNSEYFIGMNSGVMHLAAALGIKSVIILNFPSARELYLPVLKDINLPDLDWLYPQNVHLHEDDEGELVKSLSLENLSKAINGELYPFWTEDFLSLVEHG